MDEPSWGPSAPPPGSRPASPGLAGPSLNDAQSGLVAAYLPLAARMAAHWSANRPWHREDFRDAAIDGLIATARAFESGHEVGFATFARKCIRFYLLRKARECRSRPRFVSLYGDPDIGNGIVREPATHDPDRDEAIDLGWMLARLPGECREYVRLRFLEGATLKQVAARMRVGHPKVEEIGRSSLELLRASVPTGLAVERQRRSRIAGRGRARPVRLEVVDGMVPVIGLAEFAGVHRASALKMLKRMGIRPEKRPWSKRTGSPMSVVTPADAMRFIERRGADRSDPEATIFATEGGGR
jgi:RNA polymerase sigma factor (sigma-70 family)